MYNCILYSTSLFSYISIRWEYCRTNTAINSHEMNEILYVELKNGHCTPL